MSVFDLMESTTKEFTQIGTSALTPHNSRELESESATIIAFQYDISPTALDPLK